MDEKRQAAGFAADDPAEVRRFIAADIGELYEIHSYRHAAALLATTAPQHLEEIFDALRRFRLSEEMITASGGNESAIPKLFSQLIRPSGWHETRIRGDLHVEVEMYGQSGWEAAAAPQVRHGVLDSHKVDYFKAPVSLDLEWNSKDQTFDRDLYAARAFYDCGLISAGVLVTRSEDLNPLFARLGVKNKYGASTTWMGKLLPRLDAGRHGGCPLLVFGMTQKLVSPFPLAGA